MKAYKYKSYKEYLNIQFDTNKPRIPWTVQKESLRSQDIKNIKGIYKGRHCVCLGCRHDKEVNDFMDNGFEAKGIDILPTGHQIQGDINKLEDYFKDGSFDIAYSAHSLEHTNDPMHFLEMIRRICIEGLYLVIPIRDFPDVEEPIFLDVMHTQNNEDLKRELKPGLTEFEIIDKWIRDDPNISPSGAEMAFAIKWI